MDSRLMVKSMKTTKASFSRPLMKVTSPRLSPCPCSKSQCSSRNTDGRNCSVTTQQPPCRQPCRQPPLQPSPQPPLQPSHPLPMSHSWNPPWDWVSLPVVRVSSSSSSSLSSLSLLCSRREVANKTTNIHPPNVSLLKTQPTKITNTIQ